MKRQIQNFIRSCFASFDDIIFLLLLEDEKRFYFVSHKILMLILYQTTSIYKRSIKKSIVVSNYLSLRFRKIKKIT